MAAVQHAGIPADIIVAVMAALNGMHQAAPAAPMPAAAAYDMDADEIHVAAELPPGDAMVALAHGLRARDPAAVRAAERLPEIVTPDRLAAYARLAAMHQAIRGRPVPEGPPDWVPGQRLSFKERRAFGPERPPRMLEADMAAEAPDWMAAADAGAAAAPARSYIERLRDQCDD